jgi:Flp pilus assembly protein TadD
MASTKMFETLGSISVSGEAGDRPVRERATLAESRGYAPRDLTAIAEMGHHYLRCGGYRLAEVIFEGLAAIQPIEPYYRLALGLVADYLDDRARAARCYQEASRLDPRDGRPEINLAELEIEAGRRQNAMALLESAARKSAARGEAALERKARALAELVSKPFPLEVMR